MEDKDIKLWVTSHRGRRGRTLSGLIALLRQRHETGAAEKGKFVR